MTDVGAASNAGRFEKHFLAIVALLALAASIIGVRNGFAFDDIHVIVRNPRLHTLASPMGLLTETYWREEMGSMLYRPMTMVVFALQWVIGGGSPIPFHATSIVLYVAFSVGVFGLAQLIMPVRAAFIAAAIFAVHPVHVEAVANVVGQAELWVGLIVVLLVTLYIRVRRSGSVRPMHIAVIAGGYVVACGFKEHAIVLPALIVIAELLVVQDEKSASSRVRSLLPLLVAMAIGAMAFLTARDLVLNGVAVDSRAQILKEQSFGTRFFTMMEVVIEWVRLFFWPMNLSSDYSYPRIRPRAGFELSMLPAVAVLAGVAWIAVTLRKRVPAATLGISWMGIALLIPSNLVVVTGFVLAERTLLLPSVGFALCIGIVFHEALAAAEGMPRLVRPVLISSLATVLLLFTARSVTRSSVWRDNGTLFAQTVIDVPSSHRAHWMLAADLAERRRMAEALEEMDLAVALGDPNDPLLLLYGGDMFAAAGRCPRALTLYRRALALVPDNVQLRTNTSLCLIDVGKLEEAKSIALDWAASAGDERLQRIVRVSDSLQAVRAGNRVARAK